jgi:hypothetical protein
MMMYCISKHKSTDIRDAVQELLGIEIYSPINIGYAVRKVADEYPYLPRDSETFELYVKQEVDYIDRYDLMSCEGVIVHSPEGLASDLGEKELDDLEYAIANGKVIVFYIRGTIYKV